LKESFTVLSLFSGAGGLSLGFKFTEKENYRMIKAVNELFGRRIEHQGIKKYGKHSKDQDCNQGGAGEAGAVFEG